MRAAQKTIRTRIFFILPWITIIISGLEFEDMFPTLTGGFMSAASFAAAKFLTVLGSFYDVQTVFSPTLRKMQRESYILLTSYSAKMD